MKYNMTAVILAGGKNSRMKREKAFLKINRILLLEHTINVLKPLFKEIIIITAKNEIKERFSNYKIVQDEFCGCGPLAGIHVSLKNAIFNEVMVFACDMPNLSPILINSEINEFHKFAGKFQALVPKHFEGIEPLHAIYSKSVLKNIEENLLAGIYSVRSFYEKINIKYWEVEDKFVCNFINVNCPEDLEIIKKKLKLDLI
jgi:molybdopterin-guanine dinucleotide biosynthesis protein A